MPEVENKTKLKYNIRKRLLELPGDYTSNRYKLCIELHIHDDTLCRWINTKQGEKFSIPSDEFYLIAYFFECNPTDLLNA